MKISVVIPMYNESKIIEDTARTVHKYMSESFSDFEILFSDDGSRDGCGDLVRALELPNVRVVGYPDNHGKGCAVRTGVLEATGDIVMFTDADLAYGTEVIGQVYGIFEGKPETQIVIGSRPLHKEGYEGYTLLRKIMSKVYIKVLCLVGGFKLSDSQCGCKAFAGKPARDIFSRCRVDGFAFDFEAILWAGELGYSITEMPVKIINHRESKINVLRDTFKMLRDVKRIKKAIKKERKTSTK